MDNRSPDRKYAGQRNQAKKRGISRAPLRYGFDLIIVAIIFRRN